MQIRALRTFGGKQGLIRAGIVVTVDDRYGARLIAQRLAAKMSLEPLNMAISEAPENKEKKVSRTRKSDDVQHKSQDLSAVLLDAGERRRQHTLSSRRLDPPLLKPT